MKEQVIKLLHSKSLVIHDYMIGIALEKELNLEEFLVLVYFDNNFQNTFDVESLSKVLGMENNVVMEAFNSLMIKGLINLESSKDMDNRINEIVSLEGLYNIILEKLDKDSKKDVKDDIFKVFERELGRPMSSMELELINGWLISGTPEELILGALREAVYNGIYHFRYIDKIIYEWEKKGFKTMDDVNKYLANRRDERSKKKISEKEQAISDYDWLSNDENDS